MRPKNFNPFFDFLKICACIGVIALHTTSIEPVLLNQNTQLAWFINKIVTSFFMWSVPIFIMISGALHLQTYSSPLTFYQKKLKRIFIPLFFWTIFYWLYFAIRNNEQITLTKILLGFIVGPFYHLYFLVILLGLFSITPFLKNVLKHLTQKKLLYLVILFLSISVFWEYSRFTITMFIPYIGYYLLGYYLHTKKTQLYHGSFEVIGFVICMLITFCGTLFFTIKSEPVYLQNQLFFKHNSVFVIGLSITMFLFFKRVTLTNGITALIYKLHPYLYGVYIIHYFLLFIMVDIIKYLSINFYWYIPLLLVPIVFLSSLFATIFIKKLPILKEVV